MGRFMKGLISLRIRRERCSAKSESGSQRPKLWYHDLAVDREVMFILRYYSNSFRSFSQHLYQIPDTGYRGIPSFHTPCQYLLPIRSPVLINTSLFSGKSVNLCRMVKGLFIVASERYNNSPALLIRKAKIFLFFVNNKRH